MRGNCQNEDLKSAVVVGLLHNSLKKSPSLGSNELLADGTRREDCFSTEQNHPQYPLQEKGQSGGKWKLKEKTASSKEDRSLTWSTSTSGLLDPMILSRIMPTYVQLFFEMTIFQEFDSKWDGFLFSMKKIPSDEILESLYKLKNWDSSEESQTWLSQIEDNGKKKYRAESASEWKLRDKRCGQESGYERGC